MSLPPAYLAEIETLNQEVLRAQPSDIVQFCADFFQRKLEAQRLVSRPSVPNPSSKTDSDMAAHSFPGRFGANPFGTSEGEKDQAGPGSIPKVLEEDENDTITSPTTGTFGFPKGSSGPFGGGFGAADPNAGPSDDGPPSALRAGQLSEGFPAHYGMGRRTSVSAESLNPTASSNDHWSPPFHKKTPEQLERLKKSISGNFLFSHLDDEQSAQVLGALVEKPIPAKGIKVCSLSSLHFRCLGDQEWFSHLRLTTYS